MNPSSLVGHIVELLELADNESVPADSVAADFFRQRKYLGSHDRRYISASFYSIVRNRRYLNTLLDRFLGQPGHEDMLPSQRFRYLPLVIIAMLAVDGRPKEEVVQAAATRWRTIAPRVEIDQLIAFVEENRDLPFLAGNAAEMLGVRYSFPQWMVERLQDQYGVETEALLRALNEQAGTVVRVNLLKCTREECRARLAAEGIETEPARRSPAGLIVSKRFNKNNLQSFKEGWFEVQDEGSQLVSMLLPIAPGMTLIDACAGAGGKTLHLAERMEDRGEITAMDIDPRRLEELEKRRDRSGLQSIRIQYPDTLQRENYFSKADLVLVDAPCSGSGTIRRNPGMKWTITESMLRRFAELQEQLLDDAAAYVKPGGVLAYATCSVFTEENERIVRSFLARTKSFSLVPPATAGGGISVKEDGTVALLPHEAGTDGFFLALLRRA